VLGVVAIVTQLLPQLHDDLIQRAGGAQASGRALRNNSAPEQCPCQVPTYFRMCVWALPVPPSRRRARIFPSSRSKEILPTDYDVR
jgi:hypothetical protein